MPKVCDHTSVGVVIRDIDGNFALLKRAKFPPGIAPVAGHIDDHGSVEQATVDEAEEELGLIVAIEDLRPTAIVKRRIDNKCSRTDGTYHLWTVFETDQFLGDITPDPDETRGANWHTAKQLQQLANRTKAYRNGKLDDAAWQDKPGLEPIWLDFLTELGYVK